jgi:hypothetical protein
MKRYSLVMLVCSPRDMILFYFLRLIKKLNTRKCVLQGVKTVNNEYFITVENKERLENARLANSVEVGFTSFACIL